MPNVTRRHFLVGAVSAAVAAAVGDFPLQFKSGVQQVIPGVGGAASGSYGGSGRNSSVSSSKLFFVDDLDGTSVTSATYASYTKVYHGTVRGAAALSGPKFIIFCKEGIIDLGGDDIRFGSNATLCGQFAPGKGVLFTNGQISTVILYGTSTASNQVYMHIPLAPGDGSASVTGAENWDAWQLSGGDDTGALAPDNIFLTNCAGHYSTDELLDAYYGSPSCKFSIVSSIFSRALNYSTHTEGGTPGAHPYGPIAGDGKKWGGADFQRCLFHKISARMPMVAADRFNYVNNIICDPGDVDFNIAQGVRVSNDYDAATPNSSAMKANFVGNVVLRGPAGYSSFNAFTCDPDGTESTTRVPSGSQGYGGYNAMVGWTASDQAAMFTGTFPSGYVQSTLRTDAWSEISDATDLSDALLPSGAEKDPNDYSTAEIKQITDAVMACLGPRPNFRSGTIAARDESEFTAIIDDTSGKGVPINSVSGTSNVSGWPNTSLRFAPNDGGYPAYGTASETIDDILADYFTMDGGGEPDNTVITTGTFDNGRSKNGYSGYEVAALTKHFEVGGQ